MTFTWSVNCASLASVSESLASLACTLFPASISSLFSLARSSASVAMSWVSPCSLARFDCSCCSVSLRRFLASSRERSSCASASHGKVQTRPTRSRADRNLRLAGANRSECAMRLGRFSRSQRQRSDTAESRQNAYESLTLRARPGRSGAVIGVTGEDGDGAVDLLGENDARQAVRQGHGRQRQHEIGLGRSRKPKTVGAADKEGETLRTAVAKLGEALREAFASELSAAPVETDQFVRGWSLGEKQLCFGLHTRLRCGTPRFRDLDHVERRQSELSSRRGGAADIMREQLALRPLLQSAHGSDQEPHGSLGLKTGAAHRPRQAAGDKSPIRSPVAPWDDPPTTSSPDCRTREPPGGRYGR